MIPTLEQLVQKHVEYVGRLANEMQDQYAAFTDSLDIPALLHIAEQSLGSKCVRFDKIYQGRHFEPSLEILMYLHPA